MHQDKSRVKSKVLVNQCNPQSARQGRGQVRKINLFHSIQVMDPVMRVSHGERGFCTLQCDVRLPLKGKAKQDKAQDVQSQDMESRGAIIKVKSAWHKERDHQEEFLVKRGLSPQISARVLCTKSRQKGVKQSDHDI